ncbi:MAG TPA: SPOR domain-containing protein [Nitrospiria bacterium]|nr:SPOR domain-containing protein [Nitrospiria bacterium]
MKRTPRRLRRGRPPSKGRLVLFLAGGLVTALLLVVVLISLEQRSPVQSALREPSLRAAPRTPSAAPVPPAPSTGRPSGEPAPETFTFYDTLEQRGAPRVGLIDKTTTHAGSPSPAVGSPNTGSVSPQNPTGGYTVQVAAIRDRATAQALADRLRRKGYPAFVLSYVIPKRGTWYRVRVGHFKQREAAREMTRRLSRQERLTVYVAKE